MKANDDEFRRLVEQHQAMVFSIAFRMIGNRESAEEVAQDTFLKLYSDLGRLQSADHVKFWLRRAAIHRATDYIRHRARRPDLGADEWQEELHVAAENAADQSNQLQMRLEQLVASLPEAFRAVVVLRYQEDLDPGEIAMLLGQPPGTVKSNLQRALELMRRKGETMLKEFVRE